MKPDGIFLIVNGYPKEGTGWYEFVKFKNKDEYRNFLDKHGFRDVKIETDKHTIIIRAFK